MLAQQFLDPRLLAALFGGGQQPPSPMGMAPQLPMPPKDQGRIAPQQPINIANDQQPVRLPALPLDPTDQVGLGANPQQQLPQNAMPTQGMNPPGIPMPQGRPPMGSNNVEQPMPMNLGGFGAPNLGGPPMPMTQLQQPQGQPQQGGFGAYIKSLTENPAFLAGLTMLGGQGPGAGANIANAALRNRLAQAELASGGVKTADVKEYEYARAQGFTGTLADWIANKRAGAGEVSLNPVWGEDEQGNPVIGQLNKRGEFVKTKLPEGVTPSKGVDRVDLGTEWGVISKVNGQLIGRYPKDLKGAAAQTAAGKVQGEAAANLPTDLAAGERALGEIAKLKSHEGLQQIMGPANQFRPNWLMTSKGRDALARYKQIKGRSFLQAYSMLKGGGQITEIEGAKAEDAMARMDRAQSVEDFQTALTDFEDAVRIGMQKLKEKAGQGGAQPAPVQNDPLGIR